jgi:hypothetical protein
MDYFLMDTGGGGQTPTTAPVSVSTASVITYENPAMAASSFTVVLNKQPTATVTIPISSGAPVEGDVSPDNVTYGAFSLVFDSTNWNTPKTVWVKGTDDIAVDPSPFASYTVLLAAITSSDPTYSGYDPADVAAINVDNEGATPAAGIYALPSSTLVTSENLTTDTFGVVLQAPPAPGLTTIINISITPNTPAEANVSPAILTFNNVCPGLNCWSTPQMVTITGIDDSVIDINTPYQVTLDPATSTDPAYAALAPITLNAVNQDNDSAGITLSKSAIVTSETVTSDLFTVRLNSAPAPATSVTLSLASSLTAEADVTVPAPSVLTFDDVCPGANCWSTPQTVTVTGADDAIADGSRGYSIILNPATSTDPNYAALAASTVSGTNTDNEVASIVVTAGALTTGETPGVNPTFTVALSTPPTASVTIPILSGDTSEATVSPASLTFDNVCPGVQCWSTAQMVTVTGVDDFIQDGPIGYTIFVQPATSTDTAYSGLNAPDVSGTNSDNDTKGITPYDPGVAGIWIAESGATDGFALVLNTQPIADVTIPISVPVGHEEISLDNVAWGTSQNVVFTSANWYISKPLYIRSIQDTTMDRTPAQWEPTFTVTIGNSSSLDGNYNNLATAPLAGINWEDERYLFVTAGTHMGDFDADALLAGGFYGAVNFDAEGITEADNFCMADANKPAAAGFTYKAMLVDDTVRRASQSANAGDAQKNWVFQPNTLYYRAEDQKPVFTTNAKGIFIFGTATNGFTFPTTDAWTGLNPDWTTYYDWQWDPINAITVWGPACFHWSDGSASSMGTMGYAESIISNMINGWTATCNGTVEKLICVEQ